MRLLFYFAALLVVAGSMQAQGTVEPSTYTGIPPSEIILQWLRSPEPRLQAWAARYVLLGHDASLIPDLQANLERTTEGNLSDASRLANFRTTLATLDTIIQLDATIPAVTLQRIEKLGYNSQTEEFVLLSRLPLSQSEPVLLYFHGLSTAGTSGATRVATQMLALHPPKGFAAEILSRIVVTANIVVRGQTSSGGSGQGIGFGDCGGSRPVTRDWPEIGRYSFQDPPKDRRQPPSNETLFLSAPDPVYLLRSVSRSYYPEVCGGFSGMNDAIRSHIVGILLNGAPLSPFPEQPVALQIEFQSREAYRARIQAFVDEQIVNFQKVTAKLTALTLLTEEERQAAALRIDLTLQDLRREPAEDLPTVNFRPPVQWIVVQ